MTTQRQIIEMEKVEICSVSFSQFLDDGNGNEGRFLDPFEPFDLAPHFFSEQPRSRESSEFGDFDSVILKSHQIKRVSQYRKNRVLGNKCNTAPHKIPRQASRIPEKEELGPTEGKENWQDSTISGGAKKSLIKKDETNQWYSKETKFGLEISSSPIPSNRTKESRMDERSTEKNHRRVSYQPKISNTENVSTLQPTRNPRRITQLSSRARSHTSSSYLKITGDKRGKQISTCLRHVIQRIASTENALEDDNNSRLSQAPNSKQIKLDGGDSQIPKVRLRLNLNLPSSDLSLAKSDSHHSSSER